MEYYEVLKVLEVHDDTVEDTDSLGEVEIDIEDEESIIEALEDFGLDIPFTWDVQVNTDLGVVSIYNDNGEYVYQLRSS